MSDDNSSRASAYQNGWQAGYKLGKETCIVSLETKISSLEEKIAELQALVSHLNTAYDDVLDRAAARAEAENARLTTERDNLSDKLELERALTDGAHKRARSAEKQLADMCERNTVLEAANEGLGPRLETAEAENARLHIENAIFIRLLQRARRLVDPCLPNKVFKWQQDVRTALGVQP